jgi:hypothetical protein
MTLLESSIIENITRRKDELREKQGGGGTHKFALKKTPKKGTPRKKTRAELNHLKKLRKLRAGKPKDPARSKSMRTVWATSRKAMMVGWRNRRKLYGKTGRLVDQALAAIRSFLESVIESKTLIPESYEEFKGAIGDLVIALVADENMTSSDVYEAILFHVSPIQAIIEGIADREDLDVTEEDMDNIEKYYKYLDEDDPDSTNEDELPDGTVEFLEEFGIEIPEDATLEDVEETLKNIQFKLEDLDEDQIKILEDLDMDDKIIDTDDD